MATSGSKSLLSLAKKLHQYFNDHTYPFPIRWSSSQNEWIIEKHKAHKFLTTDFLLLTDFSWISYYLFNACTW